MTRDSFDTPEDHAKWTAAADSADPSRRERGVGYRDGLNAGIVT